MSISQVVYLYVLTYKMTSVTVTHTNYSEKGGTA